MECDFSEKSKFFGIKFLVDPEDFERYVKPYSFTKVNGYVRYSSCNDGLFGKLLHRVIMGVDDRWTLIDHIDGNRLNNSRSNLRVCTQQQNLCNRGKQTNNTSGFKGVSWLERKQKWRAMISNKFIGYFKTAEEGHRAYVKAAQELHGEFAKF